MAFDDTDHRSLPAVLGRSGTAHRAPRIAVIGAGPSGLTAADTLRQLGYDQVTVFERQSRVGGKVYSMRRGEAVTELGAVLASAECKLVLGLAERFGIAYAPYAVGQHILDEHGERHPSAAFMSGRYSADEIARAVGCYAAALARFAAIDQDGFAGLPSELHEPFDQFAARHGFTPIAEQVRSAMIGFGYGHYETTPALYFMKLIGWLLKPGGPNGLQPGAFFMFPGGFQSLWEALANTLDVRLGADITAVERTAGGPIRIMVNGEQQHEVDALIISAPLHTVGRLLPLAADEAALFAQVRSHRYFVNAFSATGLARGEFLFLHAHARADRVGHVNAWANRDPSSPAYIGWQLADWSSSPEQVAAMLVSDIEAQGGQLGALAVQQQWDYFPHVGPQALHEGFYERVEALQGRDGVFYVGGTLSFETVEHSARYAQSLVKKHFAPTLG